MSLTATVNGTSYTRAKSINVSRSLRNLVGWFELTSSADKRNTLPIKLGDRIEIASGGQALLTGFVEQLSVRQSASSHEIRISGRDITADLVDSTLKTKAFKGPIALEALIKRVLEEQGLSSIKVVSEAETLRQIEAGELVNGEIGQPAFEFLETYARHVQALLTTSAKGEIVILRAKPKASDFPLVREAGNQANNILESSIDLNQADRFAEYVCQSQRPDADDAQAALAEEQSVAQSGSAKDSKIRAGRFFEFEAGTTLESQACKDAAALEANVRRAASLNYRATVQGVPADVQINRLVGVRDDFAGIVDQLLVTDVEHRFGLDSGTTTTIGATVSDAFTLEEERNRLNATRSETGEKFTLDDLS